MEASRGKFQEKQAHKALPEALIYEVLDGRPLYRKDYKAVLNHSKTLEDIMGSSGLQSVIIEYLLRICYACFDAAHYRVLTNEVGSHISKNNNFAHDIAIFEKSVLTPDKIKSSYPDVPAKIVIEVDLAVELEELTEHEYLHRKTQKMLDFGVEHVFWITTKTQKVLLATPGENWQLIDWDKDIELYSGHSFNIGRYLEEEGIRVEERGNKK